MKKFTFALFLILTLQFFLSNACAYDYLVFYNPIYHSYNVDNYNIPIPDNEIEFDELSQRFSSFNFLGYEENTDLIDFVNYSHFEHIQPQYIKVETILDSALENNVKVAHIYSQNQSSSIHFAANSGAFSEDNYFVEFVFSLPDTKSYQLFQITFSNDVYTMFLKVIAQNNLFSISDSWISNVEWVDSIEYITDLNLTILPNEVFSFSYQWVNFAPVNEYHSLRIANYNTGVNNTYDFYKEVVSFSEFRYLDISYSNQINSNWYLHCINSNLHYLLKYPSFLYTQGLFDVEIYDIDESYYPFQYGDDIINQLDSFENFEELGLETAYPIVYANNTEIYGLSNGLEVEFESGLNISKEFDILDEYTTYLVSFQRDFFNAKNFSVIFSDGVREITVQFDNNEIAVYLQYNSTSAITLIDRLDLEYYKEYPITISIANITDSVMVGVISDTQSIYAPLFEPSISNPFTITLRNDYAGNNSLKIGMLGSYAFNMTTFFHFDKSVVFSREFSYSINFEIDLPYYIPRETYLSYEHQLVRLGIGSRFTYPLSIHTFVVSGVFSLEIDETNAIPFTIPVFNIESFEDYSDYVWNYIYSQPIRFTLQYDFIVNTKYENQNITLSLAGAALIRYKVDVLPDSFLTNLIDFGIPIVVFFITPFIMFKRWGKIGAGSGLILSGFLNYMIYPSQIFYNIIIIIFSTVIALLLFKSHKSESGGME